MNPYPAIEFTCTFSTQDGINQNSTWLPSTVEDNVAFRNGGVVTLYGTQALRFKKLVDEGIAPFTYRFVPYPQITSISPSSWYLSGQNYVTITGKNLSGVRSVKFGNVPAMSFYVNSDTSVTAIPNPVSTPQTVNVTVSNGVDSSPIVNNAQYSFTFKEIEGSPTSFSLGHIPNLSALGADGNVWVSANDFVGTGYMIAVHPDGTKDTYTMVGTFPFDCVSGPDGNVWFTYGDASNSGIAKITPSGVVTKFPLTDTTFSIDAVCAGPDGNMWATGYKLDFRHGYAWKVSLSGAFTQYALPLGTLGEDIGLDIIPGVDGNIWVLGGSGADTISYLVKITPDGTVTKYDILGFGAYVAFCTGGDGNFWINSLSGSFVGNLNKVRIDGFYLNKYTYPGFTDVQGQDVVAGPDGNIWVADFFNFFAWKVTPAGEFSYVTLPGATGPNAATIGSDGNVWIVDQGSSLIYRIS